MDLERVSILFFGFRASFYLTVGMRLGYEWVGWRNDSVRPVEMVFEFDSKRNFSSIIIHTNNMFSRDVQVSI